MSERLTLSDIVGGKYDALKRAIGCVLIDNSVMPLLRSAVFPDSLPKSIARTVYEKMIAMDERGEQMTCITVSCEFSGDKEFVDHGGVQYIFEAPRDVTGAFEINACIKVIKRDEHVRKLQNLGAYLAIAAKQDGANIGEIVSHVEEETAEIREDETASPWSGVGEIVTKNFSEILNGSRYDQSRIITTGFSDLDRMLTGLKPGTLTIIAARPGMGKTVLGMNIATNNAIGKGIPAAFFSLEMQKDELGDRILASVGSIRCHTIKTGNFNDNELQRLSETVERLSNNQSLLVIDIGGMEIRRLETEAKRVCKTHGCQMIVVDYLQLSRCNSKRIQNECQEITEISRSLKALAKALDVPIIAIAQLNRDVDSRSDKRPVLSDLRGSGSIEQDADNVLFIYREDYYRTDCGGNTNVAEVIVAKQRAGTTGVVRLRWTGEFSRFDNLETENF